MYIYIYIYLSLDRSRILENLVTFTLRPCHGELHELYDLPAKWTVYSCRSPTVQHRCWLENRCVAGFGATNPEAGSVWRTAFASNELSAACPDPFWASAWRQPCSCCTAATASSDMACICFVVRWRCQDCGEGWWLGEIMTVVKYKISRGTFNRFQADMFKRFVAQAKTSFLSLPFWQMEGCWPVAVQTGVVTAPECNISWGMFSRFLVHLVLLLWFWQMEAWWPGAIQTMGVIAPESKISWGTFVDGRVVTWGRQDFGGHENVQQICGTGWAFAAILADGSVVTWGNQEYGGVIAPESKISWGTFGRFVAQPVLLLLL